MSALEDLITICSEKNINAAAIISYGRKKQLVEQRVSIARALRERGYTYPEIAEAMARDHTTIQYLCKDDMRARMQAAGRARYAARVA